MQNSITQPYKLPSHIPLKPIPKDLINVLQDAAKLSATNLKNSPQNAIYIGDSAANPLNRDRYPFWLPTYLLDSHVLIAGQIGSGKTCLLMRLIAGAIAEYGSVVISEAKAGVGGGAEGAAFTHLVRYLHRKNPQLQTYRWPRGNCYFNPCKYLNTPQDRQAFFDIKSLDIDLQRLNFYIYIKEEKLIMTRHGIDRLIGLFEHEDLLYRTLAAESSRLSNHHLAHTWSPRSRRTDPRSIAEYSASTSQ